MSQGDDGANGLVPGVTTPAAVDFWVMDSTVSLDLADARVEYHPSFLEDGEAHRFFDDLHEHLDWDQEHITLFGKTHPVPRLSSWHGDPGCAYRYASVSMEPKAWTATLLTIQDRLHTALDVRFNSVLANLYRHGRDRAAWHADDEAELGPAPLIASLSLGATRRFRFRRIDGKGDRPAMDLGHGSLVVMSGDTQAHWQHEITRTARPVGPRINLTYRTIVGPSWVAAAPAS